MVRAVQLGEVAERRLVNDYIRGEKVTVIARSYAISPGKLYQVLSRNNIPTRCNGARSSPLPTILLEIRQEAERAREQWGGFNSAHEAYAVLLEEVVELQAEVFKREGERSRDRMRQEAVQVGARALRFIQDICKQKHH